MRSVVIAAVLALAACATMPNVPKDKANMAESTVAVRHIAVPSTDLFDPVETMKQAQAALESRDYAGALAKFQTLHSVEKRNEAVLLGLGNAAIGLGQGQTALTAFQQLYQGVPEHLSGLVLAEIMTGQSADIELRLNEALEADQSDPRLWNALGRYFDDQDRPLLAQDNYLKALSTGRASAGAVNNLGMSYLMAGRASEALDKFEQAMSMRPDNTLYDNNRRLVLALRGQYLMAAKGLPDQRAADILNDAGYIAKTQGKRVTARNLFEAAIAKSPRHHRIAIENLRSLKVP